MQPAETLPLSWQRLLALSGTVFAVLFPDPVRNALDLARIVKHDAETAARRRESR
jgi:hypothetical protein